MQYIGLFNFRYTVFLCLKLGIEYSLMTNFGSKVYCVFLILVFYTSFSIIFGILEGLIQVFWYSTTPPPPARPTLIYTVEPPLTATSLQWPLFFIRADEKIHTSTLV